MVVNRKHDGLCHEFDRQIIGKQWALDFDRNMQLVDTTILMFVRIAMDFSFKIMVFAVKSVLRFETWWF